MNKNEVESLTEKVELLLVEKGFDVKEMFKLYDNSGGDERYHEWMQVNGKALVKQWMDERTSQGLSVVNDESTVDGIVYCLIKYNKWLKTLN